MSYSSEGKRTERNGAHQGNTGAKEASRVLRRIADFEAVYGHSPHTLGPDDYPDDPIEMDSPPSNFPWPVSDDCECGIGYQGSGHLPGCSALRD